MSPLEHWLREQSRMHRQLYLVLDADGNTEALQALLNSPPAAPHVSLYAGTEAAPLAARGPFVMQLANRATPALATLLAHPERHWGWLASAEGDVDRFPTCLAANIRMFSQAIHEGINTLPAVTGESRRM